MTNALVLLDDENRTFLSPSLPILSIHPFPVRLRYKISRDSPTTLSLSVFSRDLHLTISDIPSSVLWIMGLAISAARTSIKEVDESQRKAIEERLHVLELLVESKLDKFESDLLQQFLNPEAVKKTSVPGRRALRWSRYSTCDITDEPATGIGSAIDSFFGVKKVGDDGKSVKRDFDVVEGLKSIVTTSLGAFLGNASTGQHTEDKFFVTFMHDAIVRIDIKLWRWNFTGFGISDKKEAVLGYIYCMSVVDISELTTSEFVFLISESAAGDDTKAAIDYIEKMRALYKEARTISGFSTSRAIDRAIVKGEVLR